MAVSKPLRAHLAGHDVHLLTFDLDAPPIASAILAGCLSDDERNRAARFHFDRDSYRFRNARGLLRLVLAAYTAIPPAALAFSYGAQGKPCLPYEGAPRFNLAHSGAQMLLGVARADDVGVDIEQHRSMPDMPAIVADCFAGDEQDAWHALPAGEQIAAFFRIWTRKEALLKAEGSGLSGDLRSIAVPVAAQPGVVPVRRAGSDGQGYVLHAWDVDGTTAAAACSSDANARFIHRSPAGCAALVA
ncbi:MAG: 4'-phosphopantetheinyl transferase family protein [Geminicoccaceae bacterium]